MGGLGVSSSSLLALPAFLASAFGASDFLTTFFSETFEDVSFTKALEKWLSLTNDQESLIDGTQKNRTQLVFVKTAHDLISRMDDKCSCRVSCRSKRSFIKASIHKTADIKTHIKGTSTSKIKHMSITAI